MESLWGPSGLQFYQKETLALVFSCEFCKTFKNTYFEEHLQTTASYSMKKNRHRKKELKNSRKKKKIKSMEMYEFSVL